jgi:Bacterial Ig domain/Secretion system C-terminal sorting domain/CHRD domain
MMSPPRLGLVSFTVLAYGGLLASLDPTPNIDRLSADMLPTNRPVLLGVVIAMLPAFAVAPVDPALPTVSVTPGTTTTLDITVGDLTGKHVSAYQFVLPYDPGGDLITSVLDTVSDPPVFTNIANDATVREGQEFTADFNATDIDGHNLTFSILSGPSGASVDPATGVFTFTPGEDQSGSHDVVVSVTDGQAPVNAPQFTITVYDVERRGGELSPLNEFLPRIQGGGGIVELSYVPDQHLIRVEGGADLISSYATAQLHVGMVNEEGPAVLTLTADIFPGNSQSIQFLPDFNSFDLSTFPFPSGLTESLFVEALRQGHVYVNIRTIEDLGGELRAQLLDLPNVAPTVDFTLPGTVSVEGNPDEIAFSISWETPVDPEGDDVRLVLWYRPGPSNFDIIFEPFDGASSGSRSFTVAEAAVLYDRGSEGALGSISLGGIFDQTFILVASDGAANSLGFKTVSLTRGLVTDAQNGLDLPNTFLLKGNYPNPFNPATSIQFDLPELADVDVVVLDMLGRTMLATPAQPIDAGSNRTIMVNASDLASGIYIYRVVARGVSETFVSTGTMALIK